MRYAVRKRERKWTVCDGRLRLLHFDGFDEALDVARNAALILHQALERAERETVTTVLPGEHSALVIEEIHEG